MPRVEHQPRRAFSPGSTHKSHAHHVRYLEYHPNSRQDLEGRGLISGLGGLVQQVTDGAVAIIKGVLGLSPPSTITPTTPTAPATGGVSVPTTVINNQPTTSVGGATTTPPVQQPQPQVTPTQPQPSPTLTQPQQQPQPPPTTAGSTPRPSANSPPNDTTPSDGTPPVATSPSPQTSAVNQPSTLASNATPDPTTTGSTTTVDSSTLVEDSVANSNLGTGNSVAQDGTDHGPVVGAGVAPSGAVQSATGKYHATMTTDSNGNVIPIETGKSGPGGAGAADLPVAARVGIGLVVTCAVLFLCAVCFFLRRRRLMKRHHQRLQWWFKRRPALMEYRDVKKPLSIIIETTQYRDVAPSVVLTPNTFATIPAPSPRSVHFVANLPATPPMAEIRNSLNVIDYPVSHFSTPTSSSEGRYSTGSLGSQDSSTLIVVGQRQSITIGSEETGGSTSTSPSLQQHFTFPAIQPPAEAAIDRTSAYFQPRTVSYSDTSHSTGSSESNTSSVSAPSIPETIIIVPRNDRSISSHESVSSSAPSNPFADPTPTTPPTPFSPFIPFPLLNPFDSPSDPPLTVANHGYGISTSSSMETDPFSVSIIASSCYGTFEEFETVRAPVIGNLSDELSLGRGEEVRVLKIFEDGWAVVEKSFGSEDAERGLIPVECLREGCGGVYPSRVDSYTTSSAYLRS